MPWNLIDAFCMCLGMFTAIPMLYRPWDEKLRPLMTACLPAVGLIIGVLWLLVAYLCRIFDVHPALAAAFVTALPALVTGAIHIDGYMDTSDAVLSWRPLEKRLAILKDPHVGSFAVIALAALSLFTYGASFALIANEGSIYPLLLIPVVSRCCSAFCVAKLKPLSHSEYAAEKNDLPAKVAYIFAAAALVLSVFSGWRGIIAIIGVIAAYALTMRKCYKLLEGFSGDLAGCALVIGECIGLIILAI